jgi:hypothetical protein
VAQPNNTGPGRHRRSGCCGSNLHCVRCHGLLLREQGGCALAHACIETPPHTAQPAQAASHSSAASSISCQHHCHSQRGPMSLRKTPAAAAPNTGPSPVSRPAAKMSPKLRNRFAPSSGPGTVMVTAAVLEGPILVIACACVLGVCVCVCVLAGHAPEESATLGCVDTSARPLVHSNSLRHGSSCTWQHVLGRLQGCAGLASHTDC